MSLEKFYEQWFESQEVTLATTEAERLQLGYRVVRELARQRGVVTPGQTLRAAVNSYPSPLTTNFGWFLPPRDALIKDQIREVELPLVPVEGTHAQAFTRVAQHIADRYLMCQRRQESRRAAICLFDPMLLKIAWPSPDDVLHFEHLLIEEIYAILVQPAERSTTGDQEALAELQNRGFQPHECEDVLRMARAYAVAATGQDDPQGFRALEISRMLQLAHRQGANGDYRGAAQTRRDILRIQQAADTGSGDEDHDAVVEATIKSAAPKKPKLQIENSDA